MPVPQLPHWVPGEPLKSRDLNDLSDSLTGLLSRLAESSDTPTAEPEQQEQPNPVSGGGGPTRFTVATEQVNTITATDGTVIAKIRYLRGAQSERLYLGQIHQIAPAFVFGFGTAAEQEIWAFETDDPVITGLGATHIMMGDGRVWVRFS